MAGKFLIEKSKNDHFFFNLRARNGQVILTSQMYKAKDSASKGIDSVKYNSPDDSKFERKTAKNGQFFFNLKATNGQIIGTSEMYTTKAAMENGIESIKKNAPEGNVVES